MVKDKRGLIVLVALVALAVWLLFFRDSGTPAVSSNSPAASARPAGSAVPWINLERLDSKRPAVALGMRDVFKYGVRPAPTPLPAPPPGDETPTPYVPPTPMPTPMPTPVPPMPLKFSGVVKQKTGPKIAILVTEQKEILYGREGETLAGRYRIVNIGLESIKVQDVTSGHEQTIRIGGR